MVSYLICTMKKYNNQKCDNVTPIKKENERDESYCPDNIFYADELAGITNGHRDSR